MFRATASAQMISIRTAISRVETAARPSPAQASARPTGPSGRVGVEGPDMAYSAFQSRIGASPRALRPAM